MEECSWIISLFPCIRIDNNTNTTNVTANVTLWLQQRHHHLRPQVVFIVVITFVTFFWKRSSSLTETTRTLFKYWPLSKASFRVPEASESSPSTIRRLCYVEIIVLLEQHPSQAEYTYTFLYPNYSEEKNFHCQWLLLLCFTQALQSIILKVTSLITGAKHSWISVPGTCLYLHATSLAQKTPFLVI